MGFAQASVVGYQQLLDDIASSGHSCQVLGRTELGWESVCVELAGEREPPVTIASVSHATESARPQATLGLMSSLSTKHKLYLIPCRDPLGLDNLATCIRPSLWIRAVANPRLDLPCRMYCRRLFLKRPDRTRLGGDP